MAVSSWREVTYGPPKQQISVEGEQAPKFSRYLWWAKEYGRSPPIFGVDKSVLRKILTKPTDFSVDKSRSILQRINAGSSNS